LWHPYSHNSFFNHNMQAWIMVYGIGISITSLYMKILNYHIQFSWDIVQWEFKSFPIVHYALNVHWNRQGKFINLKHLEFLYYPCQFETVVRDEMHEISTWKTLYMFSTHNHQSCHLLNFLIEYLNWIFAHKIWKNPERNTINLPL